MNIRKSLSRLGLVALIAGGAYFAVPQRADAEDIYLETALNGGSDANDGLTPSTPVETIDTAINIANSDVGESTILVGEGIFNQVKQGDYLDIMRTTNISGQNPDTNTSLTTLNAALMANNPTNIENLTLGGFSYGNGLAIQFNRSGKVENCILTDKGAIQVYIGETVEITNNVFQITNPGTPAIYVENSGKKGAKAGEGDVQLSLNQFNSCSPVFRLGAGVYAVDGGNNNVYDGCCPVAVAALPGVIPEVDLSNSFWTDNGGTCGGEGEGEGEGETGGGKSGGGAKGLIIYTDPAQIKARFIDSSVDKSKVNVNNPLGCNPFDDTDGDGALNYEDADKDGDGYTNAQEIAFGTDPCDDLSHSSQPVPISRRAGTAGLIGLMAGAGAYAVKKAKDAYLVERR